MRSNYWSCTKFADWLRGNAKPEYASGKEWSQWKKASKAKHRFRFWLAEEGLDKIQNFIMWPSDKLYAFKYWINNRFITHTHRLTSNLPKGVWHDLDTRILHCLFDELVNFVEIEQAWNYILWNTDKRKEHKAPWYAVGYWRFRVWRSPGAGLEYLLWASNLTMKEDFGLEPGDENYGKPTSQAITAKEIIVLYYWWKEARPARLDPYDASGWSDLCDRRRSKDEDSWWMEDQTEEERAETRSILDLSNKLEEQYAKEDEDMMIRLIKIRQGLWT